MVLSAVLHFATPQSHSNCRTSPSNSDTGETAQRRDTVHLWFMIMPGRHSHIHSLRIDMSLGKFHLPSTCNATSRSAPQPKERRSCQDKCHAIFRATCLLTECSAIRLALRTSSALSRKLQGAIPSLSTLHRRMRSRIRTSGIPFDAGHVRF